MERLTRGIQARVRPVREDFPTEFAENEKVIVFIPASSSGAFSRGKAPQGVGVGGVTLPTEE